MAARPRAAVIRVCPSEWSWSPLEIAAMIAAPPTKQKKPPRNQKQPGESVRVRPLGLENDRTESPWSRIISTNCIQNSLWMFGSYLQKHHRRALGYAPALFPVSQRTYTDSWHGGKLRLSQVIPLSDVFDI